MKKGRFHYVCFNQPYKDLQLTQYGYHRWVSSTKSAPSFKDCFVLHVVLDGEGFLKIGKNKWKLAKNKAFLLPPGEMVEYVSDKENCLEYVWIGIKGDGVDEFLKNSGFNEDNYVVEMKDTQGFEPLLEQMINHNVGETPDYFLIGKTYEFLDLFSKKLIRYYGDELVYKESWLREVIVYIRKNYTGDISIISMCKELGIERTGLFKKFKKEFGVSPQNYIIQFRLNIAENAITQTKIPFKTISTDCGFNSYPYFCKIFKEKFGMTPKEYRQARSNK